VVDVRVDSMVPQDGTQQILTTDVALRNRGD